MQKRRSRIERPRDSSFDVRSPIRITSPKLSHRYGGACRHQENFLDSSSLNEKGSLVALSIGTPCERSNTRLAFAAENCPPNVITWNDKQPHRRTMQDFRAC